MSWSGGHEPEMTRLRTRDSRLLCGRNTDLLYYCRKPGVVTNSVGHWLLIQVDEILATLLQCLIYMAKRSIAIAERCLKPGKVKRRDVNGARIAARFGKLPVMPHVTKEVVRALRVSGQRVRVSQEHGEGWSLPG